MFIILCVSLGYWLKLLFHLFILKCFQIKKVMEQERKLLFNFYSCSSMFRTFSFLQLSKEISCKRLILLRTCKVPWLSMIEMLCFLYYIEVSYFNSAFHGCQYSNTHDHKDVSVWTCSTLYSNRRYSTWRVKIE